MRNLYSIRRPRDEVIGLFGISPFDDARAFTRSGLDWSGKYQRVISAIPLLSRRRRLEAALLCAIRAPADNTSALRGLV
jgi:hypothetical protein